ncbi:hypothetical protein C9374_010513 [Naegleria lovaniensis]|uniref:Glycosyltransferase 61 catalytic domain-containing protein n=1 Tax=Naegleria lovaniensis TaxID=51637 RepID=A0AA88GGC4_NAELO|nr:uncharacterized protein C9374_010513 [Naegleria lovaniensis]KAG2374769.1 hypothetical protein C9374_010513 [Naegleria lovaniensis]
MFGNFKCNRHDWSEEHIRKLPRRRFASCDFENLCLTNQGEWLLFHSKDLLDGNNKESALNELNSMPFTYAQGREETERGLFRVKLVDANLVLIRNERGHVVNVTTTTSLISKANTKEVLTSTTTTNLTRVELDPNFRYLEKPVYALKRYAAGNMGHFLFENIMMSLLDNHILYLDDVFDKSPHNDIALYGYDGNLATNISLKVGTMISKNDVLQVCSKKGIHSIENLPCLNDAPNESINTQSSAENSQEPTTKYVLNTCFSHFLVGKISNFFVELYGRESAMVMLRHLAYSGLKLSPLPNEEDIPSELIHYLKRKNIKIGIHSKSKASRHGRIIWNVDDIVDYLRQNVTEDLKALFPKKKISIDVFEMGQMDVHDQIRLISDLDIYITDQGSSAYYAMFMRQDTTVLIAPECAVVDKKQKCWTGLGHAKLMALPHLRAVDYLDLHKGEPPMSCNMRPTHNQDNCDPILRPDLVGSVVVSAIKRRYLKLIAFGLER